MGYIYNSYLLIIEVNHLITYYIQELSIVTHHYDCMFTLITVVLQPQHCVQVQMIGGFIEQEDVGFDE